MKTKRKINLALVFFLLAAVLAVKICCVLYGYPGGVDPLMCTLSGLYYALMLGLCFSAGREKWGYSIALCVFLMKLFLLGISVLIRWEPLTMVFRFIAASHYLVSETVHGFEDVGEMFPDIIYWGAFALVYLCFGAAAWAGKTSQKEKKA